MSSLILLSQDLQSLEVIGNLAAELGIRVRSLTSPEAAREWLSMQSYDAVLVDADYPGTIPAEALAWGWRHNPTSLGAVFSLRREVDDQWSSVLQGAHVFSGPRATQDIRRFLQLIPERTSLAAQTQRGVLVVEDLDSPRDIICSYVEALGFEPVDGVPGAAECLELLERQHERYFCILCDLQMPKMNGIELIKEIRKRGELCHLPILVLTSAPTAENLIECIKAGASGFIAKPPRKTLLEGELEKAKRMLMSKQSPRLCRPDEAHLLEEALQQAGHVKSV